MKETPAVEQWCITNAKKLFKSLKNTNKRAVTYEQKEYKIGPDSRTRLGRYYNDSGKKAWSVPKIWGAISGALPA